MTCGSTLARSISVAAVRRRSWCSISLVRHRTRSSAPTPEVYGPGAEDFHTKH
jgi:hypothetical protein